MDKVLIVVGDATETVDTLYPYYRLIEAGFTPVVAAPEKRRYQMVLHEVKAGWTITKEWEGYTIEADVAFNQRLAQEAKARRRVGTGSLSDVLNFEVQVNAAGAGLIKAKHVYEVALIGLAALLGIPGAALPADVRLGELAHETPEEMQLPEAESLVAYGIRRRTDVRQAEYLSARAGKGVGVARARFLPRIDLSASFTGERVDTASLDMHDFGDALVVRFTYNLFSGGADLARYFESRALRKEAQDNLESLRLAVASEIREALSLLEAAQAELRLERSNAKLVQQNRDLVEKEYNAGQASLVRLNEAQRDLIRAQSRLALALVSMRMAWFDLKTSTGRSLIPFSGQLQ